jgi:hypothetical protein
MFGIGALVAWNAILSIMDFFQKFVKFTIKFSKKNTVLNMSIQI